MVKYKIIFGQPTEVGFLNPDNMKPQWYSCYYAKGTSMEVCSFHSGNEQTILAKTLDGEYAVITTKTIDAIVSV